MRTKILIISVLLLLLPLTVFSQENTCDRACLESFIDRYMDAMLENDPGLDLLGGPRRDP